MFEASLSSIEFTFSIGSPFPLFLPTFDCIPPSSSDTIHQALSAYPSAGSDWKESSQ